MMLCQVRPSSVVEQTSRAGFFPILNKVGLSPLAGLLAIVGKMVGHQHLRRALDALEHLRHIILRDNAGNDAEPVDLHVHDDLGDV